MCEELTTPHVTSISQGLIGIDIICNSSASRWSLRKQDRRLELIRGSSKSTGSCYLYSNQQGCDGAARHYSDGCSLIVLNGDVVAQASKFSLNEVEVITAVVDIEKVWLAHHQPAPRYKAATEWAPIRILTLHMMFGSEDTEFPLRRPSNAFEPITIKLEADIALATGCWLWDYLRRSGQAGFFLPLSGGIDSCATAITVYSAARLLSVAVHSGNQQILHDLRKVAGDHDWTPKGPEDICNHILHTCFIGTANKSIQTRMLAEGLAVAIGSDHLNVDIDAVVSSFASLSSVVLGHELRTKTDGGSNQESLALHDTQSRSRMVLAYLLASTLTLKRKRPGSGSLIVLGSTHFDEALRGYHTKYGISSADINPIGGISENDLRALIRYAKESWNLPILEDFLTATLSSDATDMASSYDELQLFGTLRKVEKLGPFSMWQRLCLDWDHLKPRQVYERVRFLWHHFGVHRHKQEIVTLFLHAEQDNPDGNRYDLLPFLQPPLTWAYDKIEAVLSMIEKDPESGKLHNKNEAVLSEIEKKAESEKRYQTIAAVLKKNEKESESEKRYKMIAAVLSKNEKEEESESEKRKIAAVLSKNAKKSESEKRFQMIAAVLSKRKIEKESESEAEKRYNDNEAVLSKKKNESESESEKR